MPAASLVNFISHLSVWPAAVRRFNLSGLKVFCCCLSAFSFPVRANTASELFSVLYDHQGGAHTGWGSGGTDNCLSLVVPAMILGLLDLHGCKRMQGDTHSHPLQGHFRVTGLMLKQTKGLMESSLNKNIGKKKEE